MGEPTCVPLKPLAIVRSPPQRQHGQSRRPSTSLQRLACTLRLRDQSAYRRHLAWPSTLPSKDPGAAKGEPASSSNFRGSCGSNCDSSTVGLSSYRSPTRREPKLPSLRRRTLRGRRYPVDPNLARLDQSGLSHGRGMPPRKTSFDSQVPTLLDEEHRFITMKKARGLQDR